MRGRRRRSPSTIVVKLERAAPAALLLHSATREESGRLARMLLQTPAWLTHCAAGAARSSLAMAAPTWSARPPAAHHDAE